MSLLKYTLKTNNRQIILIELPGNLSDLAFSFFLFLATSNDNVKPLAARGKVFSHSGSRSYLFEEN